MWPDISGELVDELRGNYESYKWFLDNFIGSVVGKSVWRSKKFTTKPCEIATATDEALGLLVLLNSHEMWKESLEEGGEPLSKKTKFTSRSMEGGHSFSGNTELYGGWSDAGLHVFNELVAKIALDRERNSEFDDEFLKEKMEEFAEATLKTKAVIRVRAVCDSLEI